MHAPPRSRRLTHVLVPAPVRRAIRRGEARTRFALGAAALRRSAPNGEASPWALQQLVAGWDNPGWVAPADLLRMLLHEVHATRGPILELGSGTSTLVLALATLGSGRSVLSLEQDEEWAGRVHDALARLGATHVTVRHVPLRPHGTYDWYDVPAAELPSDIGLLFCDGPATPDRLTPLRLLFGRMAPDGVIVADDLEDEPLHRDRWLGDGWESRTMLGDEGHCFGVLRRVR